MVSPADSGFKVDFAVGRVDDSCFAVLPSLYPVVKVNNDYRALDPTNRDHLNKVSQPRRF